MSKALDCPKCGAPMHHVPGAVVLHCRFCNTEAAAPQPTRQQPAPRIVVAQHPTHVSVPTPHVSPVRWMPIVIVMMCLPGVIGAITAAIARGKFTTSLKSTIGGAVSAISNVRYLDNGPPAIPVDLNGDGTEDVIGPIAEYAKGSDEEHLAAFDGKTQAELWRSRKIVEPWSAHTIVSGKRLLLVETGGQATLLDVATGKEKFTFSLSDKVERACVDPDGGGTITLILSDKTTIAVDPKTGDARPGKWPTACGPTAQNPFSMGRFQSRATNLHGSDSHVELAGGYIDRILTDGTVAVGLAIKSPGSARPKLVGVDLKTKATTWQSDLLAGGQPAKDGVPDIADLIDGKLYVVASQRTVSNPKSFLEAIDAGAGRLLWSAQISTNSLGMDANSLVVGPARVYVARAGALQIFSRKDGARVAVIGEQ
jgi:outer membrane protein assembly factor BamB